MIKLKDEQSFFIEGIGEVQDKGNHQYLEIFLGKPARRDAYDEQIGKADQFRALAWNKVIAAIPADLKVGDKVMAGVSFSGHIGIDRSNKQYFSVNVGIHSMRKIE
ncbi:MAG TPA: hypothetical protein DCL77_14455 [Prolixibacteraceae bacterium]|jgi:predicted alpha/beta superfamily hydrolase|nr:hypothetical protein [Prolixibacteraceae bacterium]